MDHFSAKNALQPKELLKVGIADSRPGRTNDMEVFQKKVELRRYQQDSMTTASEVRKVTSKQRISFHAMPQNCTFYYHR